MNLIGKIFTVLIFVMSLVFMAFSVAVYATHKNWKDEAKTLTTTNQTLSSKRTELEQQLGETKQMLEQERAARRYALAALEVRSSQQERQLATQQASLDQKVKELDQKSAALDQASKVAIAAETRNTELENKLQTAQQNRDAMFANVVSTSDRVQTLQTNEERLKEREGQLAQQTARQRRVLNANGLTEFTNVDGVPPKLDGRVTAIGANNFVEVSLGKDDGLSIGNTLDIFRGDQYLGRVIIRKVSPDRSVGEIQREYRKGEIKKGDYVSTKLG
ncbi:hypothetical protein [Blastopirellula marina]|uniref:Chromosome partition protein Smc n=1 Tax=Blastopirellula marina DSM 3645 TaxID=314230 RepID=A3ZLL2_9BACT|nr:hypothetical protein [Blastopirellula marina]EAQ82645.1 hypothetical protein DSM3645_09607 [Blastopirellula marina DSM 3645]